MSHHELAPFDPEIGRTLLQAGLWAITGRSFPINTAGAAVESSAGFREALIKRAIHEKMMPMLAAFSHVYDLGLGDLPSQLSEVFRIRSREHYIHLRPVMDSLQNNAIPVILLKGADLDLSVYQKRFPRVMGDIDILVQPADSSAVVDVFKSQGFIQGKLDKELKTIVPFSDSERAELEEDNIELAELVKLVSVPDLAPFRDIIEDYLPSWRIMPIGNSCQLVVTYDVHTHLSLEFDLQDEWTGLRAIDFPEVGTCLAQSFTDIAWYLAVRLYHELQLSSGPVMRSFLDVLLVILRNHDSIDWERITYIADKYKLHPSLYYVLWHVAEILDGLVPGPILDTLYPPSADPQRGHDWGDFVPKMLGEVQLSPILLSGSLHQLPDLSKERARWR